MKQNHQKSWAMAYCGIVAALCVALMLLGAVIPIAMFIAPAVAGFLVATVCVECGMQLALTAYAAVSLLALLFVPDKEVALIFVFLLGYYPLAKPKFERIRPAVLRIVCKLLLCNGKCAHRFGNIDIFTQRLDQFFRTLCHQLPIIDAKLVLDLLSHENIFCHGKIRKCSNVLVNCRNTKFR